MQKKKVPQNLRPLEFHGCDLNLQVGGDGDWIGDCPFCGKESHLYANPDTGLWDCKSCGKDGNTISFLTLIAEQKHAKTTRESWRKLSKNRGIPSGLLKARGIGWDAEMDAWLIPARGKNGKVHDIRRWDWRMMRCTAGCKSQLFGLEQLAQAKWGTKVWLCEGEWDALAMDWLVRELGLSDIVVAVPGASVFKQEWIGFFTGKDVVAIYDADEAGDKGQEKVAAKLNGVTKSLKFVHWPDSSPKGFDLRDFVNIASNGSDAWAQSAFAELLELTRSGPRRTSSGGGDTQHTTISNTGSVPEGQPKLKDMDFVKLLSFFEARMLMSDDMKDALKVMCAVSLSMDIQTDPLWVYVVGPPGAGKTMMLQAFQGSERCVFRSTVTAHGLVSGWKEGDPSLIPQLSRKCFVLKDFTEILTLPPIEQDQVYSCLRGAYDGAVDKSFGNGVHRQYNRHSEPPFERFALLAGVTNAIFGHSNASLGERFLKLRLRSPGVERSKAINIAALNSIGTELKREDELQWAAACFLQQELDTSILPKWDSEFIDRLDALVTLVARMRTRVPKDWKGDEVLYRPEPEAGTRLIKQLGFLGRILSYIDGASRVTEEVFRLIKRVAFDTAYGLHLEIIETGMQLSGKFTKNEVTERLNLPRSTIDRRFADLEVLRGVRRTGKIKDIGTRGVKPLVWEVDPKIAALWMRADGKEPKACAKIIVRRKKVVRRKVIRKRLASTAG